VEQITGSGSRRETLLSEESELEHFIRELFESQKLAVLGTQNEGQPYANLVAFAPSHDLKCLYFVTARATRKYANIEADARVTVLIDNRSNQDSDFSQAAAVTASEMKSSPSIWPNIRCWKTLFDLRVAPSCK
jgi:general stress protein 26